MKQTRLEKHIGRKTFLILMPLYKEVKRTRDIHKILLFKSFITRIVEAQWEFDENGRKQWAALEEYTTEVIMNRNSYSYEINTPLKFIIHMAENEHAYGYEMKKHLRRTL